MEGDGGVHPLLVVIRIALILIKREVTVGTAIDAQLNGISRLLRHKFHLGSQRHDRAGTYEQWQGAKRRLDIDAASPIPHLACPEVVPLGPRRVKRRKVEMPGIGGGFSN